jgi:uncharacterized protein YqhQ
MPQPFYYGGQALIEGVLIRGQHNVRMAVRRPDGGIWTGPLALSPITNGPLRRIPLIRGVIVLAESMLMGIKGLNRSAEIAMADPEDEPAPDGESPEMGKAERVTMAFSLVTALVLGVGIFFLLPLLGARSLDSYIDSSIVSNMIEGGIRLGLLIGYIWAIGHIKDIRRVFAYHGAEHMTIHAYEHGVPLVPEEIEKFSMAHPRCGTAFLLTVVLVSVLVFTMVGRPSIMMAIVSRVALVPVIAAVSYEFLRFSGAHSERPWARLLIYPGLLLQRLTTRWPDRSQIEIAVAAMNTTLVADGIIDSDPRLEVTQDGPLRTESAGDSPDADASTD